MQSVVQQSLVAALIRSDGPDFVKLESPCDVGQQ